MNRKQKILIISLFIFHLWIMTGLYTEMIPFISSIFFYTNWTENYLHRDYLEMIILTIISFILIFLSFSFRREEIKKFTLFRIIARFLGLYFFFLSGQTIHISIKTAPAPTMSQCFYFIPFKTNSMERGEVNINDHFFYSEIESGHNRLIFPNGFGPFAKIEFDYIRSYFPLKNSK